MTGMPQPNDNHKKLHRLAGDRVGEETLSPSPWGPGGAAVGRYTHRVDIDGFYVVQDYVEEKDGRVSYGGHGILGWDDEQKNYTWYWVDSMGSVPPAPSRGRWEGDTLVFEHAPVGDRRGRYTYRFVGGAQFQFKIESSQDGGRSWQTFMEGRYKRV